MTRSVTARAGRASLKCFCVSRLCAFFKWSRVSRLRAHFPKKHFAQSWLGVLAYCVSVFTLRFFAHLTFLRLQFFSRHCYFVCRCWSSFSYHHPSKFKKFIECDFQISRAEGISAAAAPIASLKCLCVGCAKTQKRLRLPSSGEEEE